MFLEVCETTVGQTAFDVPWVPSCGEATAGYTALAFVIVTSAPSRQRPSPGPEPAVFPPPRPCPSGMSARSVRALWPPPQLSQ